MQTTTYTKLENLKTNLCASFLTVPHDHVEVKQVVGTTAELTRTVTSRSEDLSFARSLGRVMLHITGFMKLSQAGLPLPAIGSVL